MYIRFSLSILYNITYIIPTPSYIPNKTLIKPFTKLDHSCTKFPSTVQTKFTNYHKKRNSFLGVKQDKKRGKKRLVCT